MSQTPSLSAFAAYLLEHRLDAFVSAQLDKVMELDLPLMKFFAHLSREQVHEISRESVIAFLEAVRDNKLVEHRDAEMQRWKENQLPHNIGRQSLTLTDIIQGYAIQRLTLISFLSEYVQDATSCVTLAMAIEKQSQIMESQALRVLQEIQQEEQEKLQENEAKYKDLFDNASDLIQVADPDGTLQYVNNAWLHTLGYNIDELTGTSVYDYVSPHELEAFRAYRQGIVSGAQPSLVTTRFVAKDGREVDVEGTVACTFKDGVPSYTRAILRDITQRKRNEEKLAHFYQQIQEQNARIDNLIKQAPDAIIVIDEQSYVQLWNPKAEAIFGWEEAEVLNQPLANTIIPPAYREAHLAGVQRYLDTGEIRVLHQTINLTAPHKQGHEFPISLTISEYYQNGKKYFVSFLRDTTEQRRTEAALEQHRKELEQRAAELEQYAWLVSHDLKEPLRKIILFADILLQRYANELPADGVLYAQRIVSATLRMSKLIEAMLTYANVSRIPVKNEVLDLNEVLSEALNDLELLIEDAGGEIITDTLPTVVGVRAQLQQLFQNLIANAVKYRKPDVPPRIEISGRVQGKRAVITVSDNGIGFDPQYAEKIFSIFQRLQTREKHEGTGIGLALCRKIVELHHGRISADSTEGQGSVFTIELPLKGQ